MTERQIKRSIDAFHNGAFYLCQPVGEGHRSGVDAMLLASLVAKNATGYLADLGAGAGAAGLAVANRSDIDILLVEASLIMAEFAKDTLLLDENAAFSQRCSILHADVELAGQARIQAGLEDNKYDHVIMNPPFNEIGDRVAPGNLKAQAHAMKDELLFENWIKTAAAIAKPNGQLSLIARPSSLPKILAACHGRFGGLEITNVQPRENQPANRILLTGIKGSKARLVLRPAIIMHDSKSADHGKSYTALAEALINGRQFWSRLFQQ